MQDAILNNRQPNYTALLIYGPQSVLHFYFRGEPRHVFAIGSWFGNCDGYVGRQWFLRGKEIGTQEIMDYPMADMRGVSKL